MHIGYLELWITDAEVWISGVVETDNWRQSALVLLLPLPCSESLLITELLGLSFPSVLHILGLKKSLMDVFTLTSLPFYFNFVCIHIYPLNAYHITIIFLSATEDICVLDSDWTRIREHRDHVSTNRKIPYS